jgi:hypothetical protein
MVYGFGCRVYFFEVTLGEINVGILRSLLERFDAVYMSGVTPLAHRRGHISTTAGIYRSR